APDLWSLVLTHESAVVPLLVVPWDAVPGAAWRRAVRSGVRYGASWCLAFNGHRIRLIDARRVQAARYLEFDVPSALEHRESFAVMWALLRAAAFVPDASGDDLVARIARASEEEGVRVRAGLRTGVRAGIEHMLSALVPAQKRQPRTTLDQLHEEALTAVYRLLFLLFAEARGLVPIWHPVYRKAYAVEALRRAALVGPAAPGIGEAFQAIGRLAHTGCRAGDLTVTAFNGRLFSPARAPRLDGARLDDGAVREALLAVSTLAGPDGRQRIAFRDLGVEELGAVYESLLEYEPRAGEGPSAKTARAPTTGPRLEPVPRAHAVRLERTGAGRRKATGTFYTPRSLTAFLVQQVLDPLVAGRAAEQILDLRVCDPAMGSGAVLVAACRYLAGAYETALVESGACRATDLDERDRAGFRRLIAQRCLFGVDLNPMAVQLARLSLWLTTLAADHPLTFLDHHLACGDSLVGAAPIDLFRHSARTARGGSDERQLPLFDPAELSTLLTAVLSVRHSLERTADTTAAVVRDKEAALAALERHAGLQRWRTACDLWCANWCRERPAPPSTLRALLDEAVRDARVVPDAAAATEQHAAADMAARLRFFHWPLEFPEVFFEPSGAPRADAGFDAVVGNPPWEMLRADGSAVQQDSCRALGRFVRRSGLYSAPAAGHANQYQLFVERALAITSARGRIGLVVPAGLALDAGAAPLRRRLLHECGLETIVGFDNRSGLFPIHRSARFMLVTLARSGPTARTTCRFGLQDPGALDTLQEKGAAGSLPPPVVVTPSLLVRVAGPDLAIPHVTSPRDLAIAERAAAAHPRLSEPRGWNARFGRELNATDHRRHFNTAGRGLPVLEGKHVAPFNATPAEATSWISAECAERLLGRDRPFMRARLAFRDVAGAANRQTVIAAIVPAGCVTTHTLFCLRSRMTLADQRVLCALLNSHALDFLVRQRVSTHVTLAIMRTIPVPRPEPGSRLHAEMDRRVRLLEEGTGNREEVQAELQARAAAAFGLTADEFAHILSTFPLVPEDGRRRALDAFTRRGC
ncbi:MAG TPA: N-6 DNA methylase, partial [Vicinamibacterales bacterium]|nr:N-6 DNA methylase [Vicinamibacterales bacterium]